MNKALFLDRDGVINVEKNFVHKIEEFDFIDGIFDLVLCANQAEYLVIVVTNQAGIARGYYSEEDFHKLTKWMKKEFAVRGCQIHGVYFCPYHPELGLGKYRQISRNRKPEPGMLLDAAKELNIDLNNSVMVGDRISDMQAAYSAGIPWRFCLGECEHSKLGIQIRSLREVNEFIKSGLPHKGTF
jgi:D-glycero-D-manno-heptose 1,7-bisphosphate phosphatase